MTNDMTVQAVIDRANTTFPETPGEFDPVKFNEHVVRTAATVRDEMRAEGLNATADAIERHFLKGLVDA